MSDAPKSAGDTAAEPKSGAKKAHPRETSLAETVFTEVMLGVLSTAIASSIVAPLDRVKLLLQTTGAHPDVVRGIVRTYSGIAGSFSRVVREQGALALWRGNGATIAHVFPKRFAALVLHDHINGLFPKYNSKSDFWRSFAVKLAAGGMTGAATSFCCQPLAFARTRLACDVAPGPGRYTGISDCIASTVRARGVAALFAGFGTSLAGAVVYRAGQFGCFAQIQDLNPYKKDKGVTGAVTSFAAVTVARTVVMPFHYPFDTIARRMMLYADVAPSERLFKGALDCAVTTVRREGVRGLYGGGLVTWINGFSGSLILLAYDRAKVLFKF
jgi:solute carrier family 25 (adenine nucleotide translocator) protein 4/5/6/31